MYKNSFIYNKAFQLFLLYINQLVFNKFLYKKHFVLIQSSRGFKDAGSASESEAAAGRPAAVRSRVCVVCTCVEGTSHLISHHTWWDPDLPSAPLAPDAPCAHAPRPPLCAWSRRRRRRLCPRAVPPNAPRRAVGAVRGARVAAGAVQLQRRRRGRAVE